MANHRVGFFFNQSTTGWNETYISKDASPAVAGPLIQRLIDARNRCLWKLENKWVGVRDAIVGSYRSSQTYLPGVNKYFGGGTLNVPAEGRRIDVAGAVERPDQVRAILQYLLIFNGNRKSIRYLSGIPDGLSVTEPGTFDLTANPDWVSNFNAFTDLLVSDGWTVEGIVAPTDANNVPVSALVVHDPAPGLLGIGVVSEGIPALGNPPIVHLRGFRRKGRGGVSLNGKFYVDSINTTLRTGLTFWFLRGTEGNKAEDWKILGKVQPVQKGLFAIQSTRLYRVGIHKRGRPSMAPRGRRLERLTLDP